jgi:hypothetical protein
MHWLKESSDLKIESPVKRKKSSVKSYLQSFVRVSFDSQQSPTWGSSHNSPKSPNGFKAENTPTSKNSKHSFDYDKIFRRLSSLNSERNLSSKSCDQLLTSETVRDGDSFPSSSNLFTPLFTSSALCLFTHTHHQPFPHTATRTNTNTNASFVNGTIQLFPSGTLIVNYEKQVAETENGESHQDTGLFTQRASQSYSCRKVLCSKYQSSEEVAVREEDGGGEEELSQVALQLRIFSVSGEGESPRDGNGTRRPTPPARLSASPSSKNSKKGLQRNIHNESTEVIL